MSRRQSELQRRLTNSLEQEVGMEREALTQFGEG